MEPIMLDRAIALGADIRQHHEVRSIKDLGDHVEAHVVPKDGAPEFLVRAKYAIGCDGARTVVGQDGGFEYEGETGLRDAVTVWLDADLSQYAAHRSGALFVTVTPESQHAVGIWTCVKPWSEWSTILFGNNPHQIDLDEKGIAESIRAAIGDDSIEFSIRNISSWQFNHVVATTYQKGRLFIAGDAAHRHPPANGLGSNTSIQDTYNLAWKLALVLKGGAGEELLDTYTVERQPVGRRIIDRAIQSAMEMISWFEAIGIGPETSWDDANQMIDEMFGPSGGEKRKQIFEAIDLMNGQFNALGVELGQFYQSGAVLADGSETRTFDRDQDLYYNPSTVPGNPLPHAWLVIDTKDVSTLDLCHYDQFTLITGAGGKHWHDAAEKISSEMGVVLKPVQVSLGLPVNDVYGDWAKAREVDDDGCVLVRPDRIVAWRSMRRGDNPEGALRAAMLQVLARNDRSQNAARSAELATAN